MAPSPNEQFIAAAEGRAEIWRTAAGVILTIVAGLALIQFFFFLVSAIFGPEASQMLADLAAGYDYSSAAATLFDLILFGFFGVGLIMAVRAVHDRDLVSLIGPWRLASLDAIRVLISCSILFTLIFLLVPHDVGYARNADMPLGRWLALLPISLAAILLQAGSEELFFRGYLHQQIGAGVRWKWGWLVLPSLLFALLHWSPENAGPNAGFIALWAFAFALAAADLTARTGTLGAAIGFHFANNIFAMLVAALVGPGDGLSLWFVEMTAADPRFRSILPAEFLTLLCAWLAARVSLRV